MTEATAEYNRINEKEEKKRIIISDRVYDNERALYGERGIAVHNCRFEGPADGESAFKECSDIEVKDCFFNLRYPFWHDTGLTVQGSEMTPLCRAALWYSEDIRITDTGMHGIKALRECSDVVISGCDIVSPEFGWSVRGAVISDCTAESEYFMLRSENLDFKNVRFKGKYSFQYIKNSVFDNCVFDTKDAFWHAENVTVKNSVINGEYLSWYSDGLTLINCVISGTQPLCYCKNLRLIDCELRNADFCFEKSELEATLTAPVISIKNPRSGKITLPGYCPVIRDDPEAVGKIIFTS